MPPTATIPAPPVVNGAGYPARPADRRTPTVSGGSALGLRSIGDSLEILSRTNDDVLRKYGDKAWDWIDRDPVAGSSADVLAYATLANDGRVVPAVSPRPGRPPDDPRAVERANRAADLCRYTLDRLDEPMSAVLMDMFRALRYGAMLGELEWTYAGRGPWRGKLLPAALRPLDRSRWQFAVDRSNRVRAYFAEAADGSGWGLYPPEKFARLTWGPRAGDPRGTSVFSRAAEAWNFRAQLPAEWFRFCQRFGSPTPVGKIAETATTDEATGKTPEQAFVETLVAYRANKAVVIGAGDDLLLMEAKTEGQVFKLADEFTRREIVYAILLQVRATMEAEHGSRADSETGSDILGHLLSYLRRWAARFVEWQFFYRIVALNLGQEDADLYCPKYDLGGVSQADRIALLSGFSQVGYKSDRSQWPAMDAEALLDVREFVEEPTGEVEGPPAPEIEPAEDEDESEEGRAAA